MDTYQLKNQIKEALQKLQEILKDSLWESWYEKQIKPIPDLLDKPCVVAIAGMVKAGKSSFINAFLGGSYATVGVTETTATINYFSYDEGLKSVPDKQKPVQLFWNNGQKEEWVSQNFLNSLQGYSEDVLKKSMDIDYLEFFLDNPLLKGIRLVDTPGVGAITSRDEHDKRTASFMKNESILRERHSRETKSLAEKADALICLTANDMVKEKDYELLSDFLNNFNKSVDSDSDSVLNNLLIVMGKADLNERHFISKEESDNYLQEVSDQLKDKKIHAQIAAASAGMESVLKAAGNETLKIMHQAMQCINADSYQIILLSEEDFLDDSLYSPGTKFTKELRKKVLEVSQWNIIQCIAREFRNEKDFDKALKELKRKSGFDNVREILEEKFIKRSNLLRYSRKLNDIINFIYVIKEREIPSQRERIVKRRREIETEIYSNLGSNMKLREEYRNKLSNDALNRLAGIRQGLSVLYDSFIQILRLIDQHHEVYDALRDIDAHSSAFTAEEIAELKTLFSEHTKEDINYLRKRSLFWRDVAKSTKSDSRRDIAKTADKFYRKFINKLQGEL